MRKTRRVRRERNACPSVTLTADSRGRVAISVTDLMPPLLLND
jgi:hypothetical protein